MKVTSFKKKKFTSDFMKLIQLGLKATNCFETKESVGKETKWNVISRQSSGPQRNLEIISAAHKTYTDVKIRGLCQREDSVQLELLTNSVSLKI